MRTTRVSIPAVTSLETALKIYYSKLQLDNADIEELFGRHANSTICALKKLARNYMIEHNIISYNSRAVDTEAAYKAWGLDVEKIERLFRKSMSIERESAGDYNADND